MTASEELEQFALKYASEAIQADKQGARANAITQYRKATEVLLKLCSLYPNASQNKLYMEKVEAYRKRIKELQEEQANPDSYEKPDNTRPAKFEHLVLSEKPNVHWEDIADLVDAKRAIQESIIYPTRRPDLFPLGWPRGILLYGPPGCGKTLLAAAVATEIDAQFYSVDAASIMSKWLGESEKNVAQLFGNAREAAEDGQPAIIFIDEIDSLVGIRSEEVGGEARVRNQFLKEMDNAMDKNKKLLIYVIGATNKPWIFDEPFIRRFQKRIYIPLPDAAVRLDMIKMYAKNLKIGEDIDLHQLAEKTDGYSGSDIRDVVQSAQIKVVGDFFETQGDTLVGTPRLITLGDFEEILRDRRPSVSPSMLQAYTKWTEHFKAL